MAFKASNIVPDRAYQTIRTAAVQLKRNLQAFNTFLSSNNANYDYLRDIYLTLKNSNAQFTSLKTTPGLTQYAADQEADPAYDVSAEFSTMQSAISSAMAWIEGNVPTNGLTAVAPSSWTAGGSLIENEFTPAQTSPLRTELSAVIATID